MYKACITSTHITVNFRSLLYLGEICGPVQRKWRHPDAQRSLRSTATESLHYVRVFARHGLLLGCDVIYGWPLLRKTELFDAGGRRWLHRSAVCQGLQVVPRSRLRMHTRSVPHSHFQWGGGWQIELLLTSTSHSVRVLVASDTNAFQT